MPPKAQAQAPIDRPLSKAYLREFSGWSTNYPPGMSDPTSLRRMENVLINKDGSARVRPGLRYLSYNDIPGPAGDLGNGITKTPVGGFETYFLNDGTKAYLFAVREADNTVGFRIMVPDTGLVYDLAGAPITAGPASIGGFTLDNGGAVGSTLNFTANTTFVKYLQVDNKIFALATSSEPGGEPMRMFDVGTTKRARLLTSIERPAFDITDKLTVRHPDDDWITGNLLSTRTNYDDDPSFATLAFWKAHNVDGFRCTAKLVATPVRDGSTAYQVESAPQKVNLCRTPIRASVAAPAGQWLPYNSLATVAPDVTLTDTIKLTAVTAKASPTDWNDIWAMQDLSLLSDVEAGKAYRIAYDLASSNSNHDLLFTIHWYNAANTLISGAGYLNWATTGGRRYSAPATAPTGAVKARVFIGQQSNANGGFIKFRNVTLISTSDGYADTISFFSGATGADYFWEGADNASASYYWPAQDSLIYAAVSEPAASGQNWTFSAYGRCDAAAAAAGQTMKVRLLFYNGATLLSTVDGTAVSLGTGAWTRASVSATAPANTTQVFRYIIFPSQDKGSISYLDSSLFEKAAGPAGVWFDGTFADDTTHQYDWVGAANASNSTERLYSGVQTIPTSEVATANTLISSTAANNDWSFGFFYSFENQIGESAFSQVTVVKAQRGWQEWKWLKPVGGAGTVAGDGDPDATKPTTDPAACADQLVAIMPEDVFNHAKARGAVKWNLYVFTWSDQEPVPVVAVKVAETPLDSSSIYEQRGWARMTPESGLYDENALVPTINNIYNSTNPPRAANGLVAADRMILVDDPSDGAKIRWTSNLIGEYTNFSPSKGGGFKTLTSGNLYVTSCVKLWQNPQSVDTLTILNDGVDGYSNAYYMAPAEVTSQSDSTPIMGFEETTNTPGTVSPFGCEVFFNSLYHPLEENLLKSTAANYNLNHKSLTDQIENKWVGLNNKHRIISSQLDKRLYYIVHNPDGEALRAGCMGNEIWVFDAEKEASTWSRFLIQAVALRKIELSDTVYMAVVTDTGIFYLDPEYRQDDYVDAADSYQVKTRYIPWYLETNTQGANRAHDAWCRLKQVNVNFGNFQGEVEWGIRSKDVHGKNILIKKRTLDLNAVDFQSPDPGQSGILPFDLDDFLQIDRDCREWFFFAGSVTDPDSSNAVVQSSGQIDFLQYRYAPASVNVGYEYGSIETFEYARSIENWAERTTDNGVPQPMVDTRRP